MEQILELEQADDITSIRSRIDFAFPPASLAQTTGKLEKRRLLLIVPRKNKTLQSLVNMKLLARVAKAKGVEIAVVSNHPTVRDYAKEAGVKVFGNLKGAKRSGWITSKTPVTSSDETRPPVALVDEEKQRQGNAQESSTAPAQKGDAVQPLQGTGKQVKKKKFIVVQGSGRVGILQQLGALVLLVILAFVLVFGLIALLPEATVTLTPAAQPIEARLVVKADPEVDSIDFKTLTFPAHPVQIELKLSDEIETIETELARSGQGGGTVTFINRTPDEQVIPISTTLSTSVGEQIKFVIVETATIPAGIGATTSTLAVAVEPGPKGNVQPAQINRFDEPAYALLARVINEQPFSGGTMEPTRVVVQADKERLQAHLRQRIQQEGLLQLQERLGEQEFIPPESLEVIVLDVTYKEFSGDFSNTFGGEMQAVVRGTVVGGYNANRLALAALQAQVPPGFELDIDGLHFGAGEVLDVQNRMVTFRVFANGRAIPIIDVHNVAQQIAWLPIGEAQARLAQQYELATVPGVELNPDWLVERLGRMPFMPLRINVVVNEAVTLMAEGG